MDDLIRSICEQNLAVYRASPIRLREDVGQEAEIAHDYRGRLVYELLQNADDAMAGSPSTQDTVFVRLTDTDLWVGNSGRPLDEDDVRGLCGIGASSKGGVVDRKRASIGHKGMGFKSVLEITAAPEVVSETFAFRLGRELAAEPVAVLMREIGEPPPERVPAMRFPSALDESPAEWSDARAAGLRTLFRFPLRADLSAGRLSKLADRLVDLPMTAILFLKHLERIDVAVETADRSETFRWVVSRRIEDHGEWTPVAGLSRTGLYRVVVRSDHAEPQTFLVAHDDDLEIGSHRVGLDEYAWSGVELSEVSVAVRLVDSHPVGADHAARVLHVFLPTGEPCPYPIVINGAFSADLSRQEVRVSPDPEDYNGWLLSEAARVFADQLVPALLGLGATDVELLALLDRDAAEPGGDASTQTGQVLVTAMRGALGRTAVVPTPAGPRLPLAAVVVPPLVDDDQAGGMFRSLLSAEAGVGGRTFPVPELCAGRSAFVLADHGAAALDASEAPAVLAAADLSAVDVELHESELVWVDPVLRTLERIWSGLDPSERTTFETAVREAALFPTDGQSPGELRRVAVADRHCFYPPRALSGAIPLEGLCFLSRDLCWGDLVPAQRQEVLHAQLAVWQALFGVREFKFPDVMRSSVLPALTLPDTGGRTDDWNSLRRAEVVAAVCQLSGRTPNPSAPLPYERLGPNRALFNLARLPVPCRADESGELTWEPAYTVYFGTDWIGDASVEALIDAVRSTGTEPPGIPFLASPSMLVPLLEPYEHLRKSAEEDEEAGKDDEVDINEDEEQALDTDHHERWISFLTWLGVNHVLRPVHFSDVEDRQSGWLTTRDLARPGGWAFRSLDDDVWSSFAMSVREDRRLVRARAEATPWTPYFYELHDLEFLPEMLRAASGDRECVCAKALLVHLVENWSRLQGFSRVTVAIPETHYPGRRQPARAYGQELLTLGDNLWLHRLRGRDFLPTTHGPKNPAVTWERTREIERRFSRRDKLAAGELLPILDIDDELAARARPLCTALGVRNELTSSSLVPADARTILDRLAALFGHRSPNGARKPDRAAVREVIRPTYRNIIELLPGTDADERFPPAALKGSPLLEDDGRGNYRFVPSEQALWAERNGTRERLGNPPDLWTFVLDASPGPRIPLTRLLDVRVLEEQLHWQPDPGDDALDAPDLARFRDGLGELAPFILARLSADRATETLQARDASLLRRLLTSLTPVQRLDVGCRLDGRSLASRSERSAFVDLGANEDATHAFVRWGENGWPPSEDDAEALATALAEAFGAGHFEAFLALIHAPNEAARRRLLALAGTSADVEAFVAAMVDDPVGAAEGETTVDEPLLLPKEAGAEVQEQPAERPEPGAGANPIAMTPLYSPGDLLIGGTPVSVTGEKTTNGQSGPPRRSGPGSGGRRTTTGYGGRTDLSALDALGMFVAMTYEVNRLTSTSIPGACILDPSLEADQPEACVFDISSPALIAIAHQRSEPFRAAINQLAAHGVHQQHPGCDILTLQPGAERPIDRLIELKSSGQHARTQAMTWNEWKTAQNDELRSHFYLYLVGNLRSDLPDAPPFLRTVRDPYATIRADEQIDQSATRRVVLRVAEFDEAEHLELGVAARDADPN
jgi:hypothetical protein